MKKILALVLALLMVVPFVACGAKKNDKTAFEKSKVAFQKTTEAYLMVNEYSIDLYDAWHIGINEKSRYDDEDELSDFALELGLDIKDMEAAIASLLGKDKYYSGYYGGDWETLQSAYGSFFSACVNVVSEVYRVNGEVENISDLLIEAKASMKELSDKYSDYENYSSLKTYFTNTLAFFDFCQNPEGSFEQVVETFNNYRNTARTCFFDLNYIFEDSIDGMYKEDEEFEEEADIG